MNTELKLKPIHLDTVIQQLLDLSEIINYHLTEIAPNYDAMEKWEQKEYSGNFEGYVKDFKTLKQYIITNESVFNEILSQYNLSVSVFIVKHLTKY